MPGSPISSNGAIGWRSSGWICGTRPAWRPFASICSQTRARLDFIINNACQTVRRPPDFYQHMMARETGPLQELSAKAARLLGGYEGLRGYHLLPEGGAALAGQPTPELAGLKHAAELSQVPLLPEEARRATRPVSRRPPGPGPAAS